MGFLIRKELHLSKNRFSFPKIDDQCWYRASSPLCSGYGNFQGDEEYQATGRSAAAAGLLVVSAYQYSKCLRLASTATDWGRDIFAVPGSIHDPQSKGCHLLLRQGAHLTEYQGRGYW